MRSHPRRILKVLFGLAVFGAATITLAQNQPAQQARPVEGDGVIEQVAPTMLQVKGTDASWLVRILPGQSKVSYSGTAEPDFLKPKLNVKFNAAIDDEGKIAEEIKELETYTPQSKADMGLFAPGSGDDAKPVRNAEAGNYLIKGPVGIYKAGELTLVAGGKKIVGKLSPSAVVKINADDLSYAQAGDSVKMKGFLMPGGNYGPQQQQQQQQQQAAPPRQAMASEITITGAKPLSAPKKGRPGK